MLGFYSRYREGALYITADFLVGLFAGGVELVGPSNRIPSNHGLQRVVLSRSSEERHTKAARRYLSVRNVPHTRGNPDLLGNGNHTIRVPEGQSIYDNRAPVMANRNLVITDALELITVGGGSTVYDAYHFRDADHVQKSSQVVCEFLHGIIRDRQRLICLAISEHIRSDDTITRLNPRANLVSPTVPIYSLIRGLDDISASIRRTKGLGIHVSRAG